MVSEREPDAAPGEGDLATGPAEAEAGTGNAPAPAPREDFEAALREQQAAHREAVARLEARAEALQRAYRGAIKERELATALAGRPLVAGGAAQLITLLRDEVDVVEEDGRFRVVTRDGKPLARAVADWLASEEYAHFCRPAPRVGTAVPGAGLNRAAATPAGAAPAPRTLGEAAVQHWRESASQAPGGSRPIGLHRRRS
jgi:hypothetical protein